MARIRTVKPDIARHRPLFDLEVRTGLPVRFVWAVLPTACDRDGRFRWRPWELKLDLAPYDTFDFAEILDVLWRAGQLIKYRVGEEEFGWVPTFAKHQVINNREAPSTLPDPMGEDSEIIQSSDASATREARVRHARGTRLVQVQGEGKGKTRAGRVSEGSAEPTPADAVVLQKSGADVFIAAYCDKFRLKYGTNPPILGKEAGIAKRVVKHMGPEKIEAYLDAFFSLPDAWLLKRKHPMDAFEAKLNELTVFLESGEFTTNRQSQQLDDMASNLALLNKVRKESTR